MEAWAKGAVEKLLMMLKVSMCEAEDGPAAGQRAGLNDKTRQTSVKSKAGRGAGRKKRKSVNRLTGCREALCSHTAISYTYKQGFIFFVIKLQNQRPEALVRRERKPREDSNQQ